MNNKNKKDKRNNNKNTYLSLFMLFLYTVFNVTGLGKNVPSNILMIFYLVCALLLVVSIFTYDYFKRVNVYVTLFFASIAVEILLVVMDYTIYGKNPKSTNFTRNISHYICAVLFFGGIICGAIGAIKVNRQDKKIVRLSNKSKYLCSKIVAIIFIKIDRDLFRIGKE
ncbi:hypothetical protein IAI10_06105 [Clostridium sp. 19966]|uniref:hypothetical protein n=1 Tax=Clostridium sp. 19966 TaxID=2768166 RepID=UPI0028DF9B55|nr:hypothetical protein [Clostridium sp. 19966]MDT8716223.1 hypothetical protein [Clostridium sp. 19966]